MTDEWTRKCPWCGQPLRKRDPAEPWHCPMCGWGTRE